MNPQLKIVEQAPSIMLGYAGEAQQSLLLRRANRHGLVAGATGTGKTVTLQSLAARFSDAGVPVFAPDIKGDLKEISRAVPCAYWDLYGKLGQDIQVSVRDMGSTLFSRVLELNDTQDGMITIMFALAAARPEFALDTFQDVRNLLNWMIDNQDEVGRQYGMASKSSIQTIQRKMLKLELNGATQFFGPTNFALEDLLRMHDGRAVVNILRSETLINDPVLYSTFLFWLLNELFTKLPEVGDPEKPRLVFFFDEAHLLFSDANRSFTQTIERVIRLIRSKGVGIYFITQSPADIPDAVLSQLGNRVQHALRAYTPSDQKSLKAAAESFRPNPEFDTATTIKELKVGEALVSLLDFQGVPGMVQRTKIGAVFLPEGPEMVVNARKPAPVVEAPAPILPDNVRPDERKVIPFPGRAIPLLSTGEDALSKPAPVAPLAVSVASRVRTSAPQRAAWPTVYAVTALAPAMWAASALIQ